MRIAIDVRKLNDFGIGTYIRHLVRHLPRIDPTTDTFLFCLRDDEGALRSLGDRVHPVVISARNYSLTEHVILPAKLRRLGVELFHAPHYVVPLFTPCPSVVTIHDVIHLLFPQYLPSRMAVHYARYMIRRALEKSSLVLTVSDSSKRDLLTFFDVNPDKIRVIPNGIDRTIRRELAGEDLEHLKERFQITGRTVLFAGNIKPHKNLERLIAAFAKVRHHEGYEDLHLIVVGDEISKYPSLRRAVERHQVRKNVRFFGFVPELTLVALYRMADVFVFPSLYEGFGLPPLEAMANGTPVVTSNISALPEVVGDAALTVDPYNIDEIAQGIRRVLEEPELRARLVAKGYERVERFSWERSVTRIYEAYQQVLGVEQTSSETARAACGSH